MRVSAYVVFITLIRNDSVLSARLIQFGQLIFVTGDVSFPLPPHIICVPDLNINLCH